MSNRHPSKENSSTIPFNELYRILSDQAGDAIFVMDLKGIILYANPAVKDVAGFTPTEYIGKHFEGFVDKSSLAKAWEFFKRTIETKKTLRDELNVVDRHGNIIPVEFTVSPIIQDGRLRLVHAIVRNISQKKFKEDMLRGSEKLKTVQHLIAGTIKEIEHPLKVVLEHFDLILDKYKDRGFEYVGYKEFKEILHSMTLMRRQVKDSFELTQRLLLINRKKAGIKEEGCNPNAVIEEVVALFEHELKAAGITVKRTLNKKIGLASIGVLEFNQVFVNVFNNAMQAIAGGGTITLKSYRSVDQKSIIIECKDTGMGIAKEALKHVFEPFFTTKQSDGVKNLGLGLSIVYSILCANRGQIFIKSSVREGTTVTIQLSVKK